MGALLYAPPLLLPPRRISASLRRLLPPLAAASADAVADAEPSSTSSAKFQWETQWYPLAPVVDLDKRMPHSRTVLGRDVVVWWDRIAGEWRVFEDACPHRLAPLSEGRIDPKGRLQCVYHGWCFAGDGSCRFIPQAPALGPPVHENPKACVSSYPCVEQNKIVWFWASSDPQYRDILERKKPPFIPELDDPSFTSPIGSRELSYGYEVLTENLMDPSHVLYVHKGLMGGARKPEDPGRVEFDREGGAPIDLNVKERSIEGFSVNRQNSMFRFIPPCIVYGGGFGDLPAGKMDPSADDLKKRKRALIIFMCVPVGPGRSRVIWAFPRNFAIWLDKIVPRWVDHLNRNIILDSDLYLLHVEERKIAALGISNWHKECYVPAAADNMVIAFREWLRLYSNGQVGWPNTVVAGTLPATPPREQLLDRYWSHVAKCSSCSGALRALKALEVALQVISVAAIGIFAIAKDNLVSRAAKTSVVVAGVAGFAISLWLSRFIYKNFYFHDYNHAFK